MTDLTHILHSNGGKKRTAKAGAAARKRKRRHKVTRSSRKTNRK